MSIFTNRLVIYSVQIKFVSFKCVNYPRAWWRRAGWEGEPQWQRMIGWLVVEAHPLGSALPSLLPDPL